MKKTAIQLSLLILLLSISPALSAQTASTSDNLVAQPTADRVVPFDITDSGISKTIEFGADLAWDSEQNFRRVILFGGIDQLDVVRVSHQPSYPLVNGTDLTQAQLDKLNYRLYLINTYAGSNVDLAMNCDHSRDGVPYVDAWYVGQPSRWYQLIKASAQEYINAGHNLITVGTFNEPDYGWGQGSAADMYNITSLINNDSFFDGVRISGGNTLNCDEAQGWYDYLKPVGVDEGNTHQLAGSFDGFASFLQNVRANGHHATLDEMHNVSEGLVGYEYGMQTGIWWGPAEYARGEMVKAFDGERIGYAEHRPNWTAAAVYRTPEGKIQAFGGTSERQAYDTSYNFLSKDRVVYYDGHGPQRAFVLDLPGGTGYDTGQTNAERVINITWGEDIQPVIDGQYVIVNKKSGLVLTVSGNTEGANVYQGTYTGSAFQQWDVTPVDSRVGGDFSYYRINPINNTNRRLDLNGFSLDNGANIQIWSYGLYGNQQWYFEYVGDGYFHIRSRESSKAFAVAGASMSSGANVIQWSPAVGDEYLWRLLPVGSPIEFMAPTAPTNLFATAQDVSIKLDWSASPEGDVIGYTVLRAKSAMGPFNTIARNVTTNSLVDNTVDVGVPYFYMIRAEDNSLNKSGNSNQVSATATGGNTVVAQYDFENSKLDTSINLNHSASYGTLSYEPGQVGSQAVRFNGTTFLQLPEDIAKHQEITVATWVYRIGNASWQRIFDFGNSTDEYMFLTPWSNTGKLHFGIKNGGTEQSLQVNGLATGAWYHVAVTIGSNGTIMYLNGNPVAQNPGMLIRPMDFNPLQNYIGNSQWPDPLFNGRIDDFRVYNYALSPEQITSLYNGTLSTEESILESSVSVWPNPAKDVLHITTHNSALSTLEMYDLNGRMIINQMVKNRNDIDLDISNLTSGIYILKINSEDQGTLIKKVAVRH